MKKGTTRAGRLHVALAVILLAVFCFSAYKVCSQLIRDKREDDAFQQLARRAGEARARSKPRSASSIDSPNTDSSTPETDPQPQSFSGDQTMDSEPEEEGYWLEELARENADLFAWITIEGTKIDYPVMSTPDDPEYYLHRAFDKTSSASGVPFLSGGCFEGCGNYIIYGHHMKNGTMFAGLLDYADMDFWEVHQTIHLDTLDGPSEYQILGAFYSRVYKTVETEVFRYYRYTDLTSEETFNEYVEKVRAASLYDTGVDAAFGDQLLTLSTCNYHTDDGRFVVVAKRVDKDAQ